MSSEVTSARQYSVNLPQGGLEAPCKLTFTVPPKEINKLHKLLSCADFKELCVYTKLHGKFYANIIFWYIRL